MTLPYFHQRVLFIWKSTESYSLTKIKDNSDNSSFLWIHIVPALWEKMHVFRESYKIIAILLDNNKQQNGSLLSVKGGEMTMQFDHWAGDSNGKFSHVQHS